MPFIRNEDGDLVPGEAQECQSAGAAIRKARSMSGLAAGAVAFSRSGEPASGEFADAEVLASFGETLSAEEVLAAD